MMRPFELAQLLDAAHRLALEPEARALAPYSPKYAMCIFPLHPPAGPLPQERLRSGDQSDPACRSHPGLPAQTPEWLPCLCRYGGDTQPQSWWRATQTGRSAYQQLQILIYWLKQIFPQMLEWFDGMSNAPGREILLKPGPLPALQKSLPETLRKSLHSTTAAVRADQQRLIRSARLCRLLPMPPC